MTTTTKKPERFLSGDDLRARGITFSRQSIWRLVKAGDFPRPVQVSAQRSAWRESDIDAWMASRPLGGPEPKAKPGKKVA